MEVRGYSEWQKRVAVFASRGTVACPDCGERLPVNDDTARQAHYRQCQAAHTLSTGEQSRLAELEVVIERGLQTFFEVGAALLEIRDNGLYQPAHKTFEDYCRVRWNMSKTNANYLIAASKVIENLTTGVVKEDLPQHEKHVRPLASLAPDEQVLVWQVIRETAPGGNVTEAHARSVVNVLKEITATGAIDDGSGEQISPSQATLTHLKAAVTEETYERLKRQETYIAEKQTSKNGTPAMQSSEAIEYYTPIVYLDAARRVLGVIDLDPASCAEAQKNVQAGMFYDRVQNGLQQDWRGRVWLNPPYGGIAAEFVAKLLAHYEAGEVPAAILLVNANSTDTAWFQPLWQYTLCFTHHRIDFISPTPKAGSTHGSVFIYLGNDWQRFAHEFAAFGNVVRRVSP